MAGAFIATLTLLLLGVCMKYLKKMKEEAKDGVQQEV
jgi:hypothetical protein